MVVEENPVPMTAEPSVENLKDQVIALPTKQAVLEMPVPDEQSSGMAEHEKKEKDVDDEAVSAKEEEAEKCNELDTEESHNEQKDERLTSVEDIGTNIEECPFRAAAIRAIENNHTTFDYPGHQVSARDVVRQMHSFRLARFPEISTREGKLFNYERFTKRRVNAKVDLHGISWSATSTDFQPDDTKIIADNIIGAKVHCELDFQVYFFLPGKGQHQRKLKRVLKVKRFRAESTEEALKWVEAIQALVKWQARVPAPAQRKVRVVVNPHSGKKQGPHIWKRWKPYFDLANIQYDVEETRYSAHAVDMGKQYCVENGYEAMIFIGGDGTVNEFLNGLLQRSEAEWRRIVACTPISLLSAGTDNAFGRGVGTPTHEASVYCIIKRKIRPVDVVACRPRPEAPIAFACCGASYGIGADIAEESEQTRWMGVYRYKWLKLKRGLLFPKQHTCQIKYVAAKNDLRTFDELEDEGIDDQHHVENCSIYNPDAALDEKTWRGEVDSIHQPASEARFEGQWQSEGGDYVTVGAANLYFEAKYSHPSDGLMDLITVRKSSLREQWPLLKAYILGRDPMDVTDLMKYNKIKALIIEEMSDEKKDSINFDGEVLEGPGPFCMEIVPRLFNVLSEK